MGADTAFLSYDPAGRLRRADNSYALVRRGYTPGGLLSDDTLVIRTYETSAANPCGGGDRHGGATSHSVTDFTSHVYALHTTYDLDGRRVRLYHPDAIDFCSGRCDQKYEYDATTGDVARLIVEKPSQTPDSALFTYDALGRLTVTRHLSGVSDTLGYDNDSRVNARHGPFGGVYALSRDALGRLTSGVSGPSSDTTASFQYGPLGALVYTSNLTQGTGFEEFDTDALGNRTWQRDDAVRSNYPNWDDRQKTLYLSSSLQLDSLRWSGSGTPTALTGPNGLSYWAQYDGAGNVQHTAGWEPYWDAGSSVWRVHLNEAVSWYDAEERLQATNRGVDLNGSAAGSSYEEYRYDALGRRVLVRSRCTETGGSAMCKGYLERTVWDGDQVLYEIRAPGQDSVLAVYAESEGTASSGSSQYDNLLGVVGYIHAGGIDQPLGVYHVGGGVGTVALTPHPNFLGEYAIGSLITVHRGYSTVTCPQSFGDCPSVTWPGGNITADGMLTGGHSYTTWFGNLLSQKTDGSGLHFMRNRYYDPQTGRFTQQDPIGLAGGLNAYGFADGDPANFSDPFGLQCQPRTYTEVFVCLGRMAPAINRATVGFAGLSVLGGATLGAGGLAFGAEGAGITTIGLTSGAGSLEGEVASLSANAYDVASAGGRHAGFLRNYAARSASELRSALGSLERNTAEHLAKIRNPASAVPDFASRTAGEQQGLLAKWLNDAIRNAQQANIIKGILERM